MSLEDDKVILPDESGQLEYKIKLTESSEFVKEIVALANSSTGGKIVIGITNEKQIKGIRDLSPETITNVARDRCKPPLIPNIIKENHNGGDIMVVEIPIGIHPPYMTDSGRYMIRVGPTVRDASIDELIDLIVKGPQKGTILLRAKSEDLESSILAAVHSGKQGSQDAVQGILELTYLIHNATSEQAKLNGILSLDKITEHSLGFNNEIVSIIVNQLPLLVLNAIYPNSLNKPSPEVMNKTIDILKRIFLRIIIPPVEIELAMKCLDCFFRLALASFYTKYENEMKRIREIVGIGLSTPKVNKYCENTLKMINEINVEYMPRRLGQFLLPGIKEYKEKGSFWNRFQK